MDDNPTTAAPVDTAILRKAGLTESQAKGYLALIENGELSPVELAEKTGESRTNGYMICDKLVALSLATKKEGQKALYTPSHPSALETLAEKRRKIVQRNEIEVKNSINPLIELFYAATEMPGARTLEGLDGIKEVFADIIRTEKDVYFIRTSAQIQSLPASFYIDHREDRAKRGIVTHALTPDAESSRRHYADGTDVRTGYSRTFYNPNDYNAPAEIQIYGDKIALISYGQTQMATLITSPALAEAMRQIFALLAKQLAPYSDGIKSDIRQKATN